MNSDEFEALAHMPFSRLEIRALIDAELSGTVISQDDMRMVLASDLLCDAALEIEASRSGHPTMKKSVVLNDDVQLDLADFALVENLRRERESGNVTPRELEQLLLRGSVANAVSNALAGGAEASDLEGATIALTPIGLINTIEAQAKPSGFLGRLFGKR